MEIFDVPGAGRRRRHLLVSMMGFHLRQEACRNASANWKAWRALKNCSRSWDRVMVDIWGVEDVEDVEDVPDGHVTRVLC